MAAINVVLANCGTEHPVFYEDEVDIHLNPKISADWQVVTWAAKTHCPPRAELKVLSCRGVAQCYGQSQLRGWKQQRFIIIYQNVKTSDGEIPAGKKDNTYCR